MGKLTGESVKLITDQPVGRTVSLSLGVPIRTVTN